MYSNFQIKSVYGGAEFGPTNTFKSSFKIKIIINEDLA